MDIEKLSIYEVKIKLRETYNGNLVKESFRPLNGKTMYLTAMWICEDDERYPGEWVFSGCDTGSTKILMNHGIPWIASGYLEIIGTYNWGGNHGTTQN